MTSHRDQNAAIRDQFGKQASSYARVTDEQRSERPIPLIDAVQPTPADGQTAGLEELTVRRCQLALPVEAILATSFPAAGDLERVREIYREDAASGHDRLGLKLREENGQLLADYPMTIVVWRRGDVL